MKDQNPTILNYLLPLAMLVLGALHWIKHGLDALAIIPIVLGVFALYMALFNRKLLQQVLGFVTKLWSPVGQFITVVILTITFFLIFAPVGLLLWILKKDVLNKEFKVNRSSYWLVKSQNNNYTQQF